MTLSINPKTGTKIFRTMIDGKLNKTVILGKRNPLRETIYSLITNYDFNNKVAQVTEIDLSYSSSIWPESLLNLYKKRSKQKK